MIFAAAGTTQWENDQVNVQYGKHNFVDLYWQTSRCRHQSVAHRNWTGRKWACTFADRLPAMPEMASEYWAPRCFYHPEWPLDCNLFPDRLQSQSSSCHKWRQSALVEMSQVVFVLGASVFVCRHVCEHSTDLHLHRLDHSHGRSRYAMLCDPSNYVYFIARRARAIVWVGASVFAHNWVVIGYCELR